MPQTAAECLRLANALSLDEQVACEFGLPTRVFQGKAHQHLFSLLWGKCKTLSEGGFVETQGVAPATALGVKGIGKTVALQTFVTLCGAIFPNVIATHVDFAHVGDLDFVLRENNLVDVIAQHLDSEWEIAQVDDGALTHFGRLSRGDLPFFRLYETLEHHQVFLFLVVDELDQLYRMPPATFPRGHGILGTLATFGTQPTGSICTIACGSSLLLMDLIATNASPEVRKEFPLVIGAVSLNESKFREVRISSSPPNDLKTIADIVGVNSGDIVDHVALLRAIMFGAGCNARNVQMLRRAQDDENILMSLAPENAVSGHHTLNNPKLQILYDTLMDALVDANRELLELVCPPRNNNAEEREVDMHCVRWLCWEAKFKPVSYQTLLAKWQALIFRGAVLKADEYKLVARLLHLADRSWIVLDGVEHSRPRNIYPASLSRLASWIIREMGKKINPG